MSVATLVRRRSYGRLHLHRHRFDWDAQLYFNRLRSSAGVELAVDDRVKVSAFCRGLKKLGYWNSLVEGWTFRSGQNAGAGATAYGLKGVKNGTIFGGPTWGANGITLDTDTKGITLAGLTTFAGTAWTLILVFDYLGADVGRSLFCPAGTVAGAPNSIRIETSALTPNLAKYVGGITTEIVPAVADAAAGFGSVWASRNGNSFVLFQNNNGINLGTDAVALAASADYNIGNRFSDAQLSADAVFAHVLLFNIADDNITGAEPLKTGQVVQLLKDTISNGLSLP
jgi:hypothetical protein